ncbi:MAG TPA: Hsp20/alpha crystallin family protein [Ktedonobacteraceae bacterium]|jgi:HSP20 family protein
MSEKDDDQKKQSVEKASEIFSNRSHSFSDLFRSLGNLIDFVASMDDDKNEERYSKKISDPSGRFKAAFELSVKTGLNNRSDIETVDRRIMPTQETIIEEETRPIVDVFDEGTYILIIAELPGVEEKDIHIEVHGDIVVLSTANRQRRYFKEVILPGDVDESTMHSKYNNGVLEIKMSRKSYD